MDTLEDLVTLHVKFRLRIRLSDFMQENKREVAATVLDWCTEEEMPGVVEGFLNEYLARHGLNSSEVLTGVNYCQPLSLNAEFL